MGLWLPIILLCSAPYAESCVVITGNELVTTKEQCFANSVEKAKIARPKMYELGYANNNCIGCVKGGMGYWNKIRVDFPDTFAKMAETERQIGNSCIRNVFLDELNPNAGHKLKVITPDCGNFCDIEFTDILHPRVEEIYQEPKQLELMFDDKQRDT